MKKRKERKRDK
jgi:hypothetical protein